MSTDSDKQQLEKFKRLQAQRKAASRKYYENNKEIVIRRSLQSYHSRQQRIKACLKTIANNNIFNIEKKQWACHLQCPKKVNGPIQSNFYGPIQSNFKAIFGGIQKKRISTIHKQTLSRINHMSWFLSNLSIPDMDHFQVSICFWITKGNGQG